MNANVKEINELTFFKEEDDCSLLDEKNTEPILKSAEQNTEPTLMEMEKEANRLIEQGETELAVKQIYGLVIAFAQEKDFTQANVWRDKLMEIDPMALTEIVDSAEVIEAEQANAIDGCHKTTWKKLYSSLSLEEANAFYMNLKQREFPPGKVLIQQGQLNNTLFFIDQGRLKIIFKQQFKEAFLKELDKGDTAGQDTFFPVSICTASVVTVTPVKIMSLDRSDIQEIEKELPGITKKLENYCSWLQAKNTEILLKNKALERRQHNRFKVEAEVTSEIIDQKRNPVGSKLNGCLHDISAGGACFSIRGSNKDISRTLLGRMTNLAIRVGRRPIQVKGLIVGVKFDGFTVYTIHLKFPRQYSEESFKKLIDVCHKLKGDQLS